ncbi:hypothetical protein GDO81_017461 [Engystomops pustulosus]|uniref:Uncharacterized protein n=1 Tax=Engystomops pustulosus TaxID=76066 RepID=A0AAV7AK34_ENGPU|nr:hypothetical protein GDO81_017461 [Engystomops pustulosus]
MEVLINIRTLRFYFLVPDAPRPLCHFHPTLPLPRFLCLSNTMFCRLLPYVQFYFWSLKSNWRRPVVFSMGGPDGSQTHQSRS